MAVGLTIGGFIIGLLLMAGGDGPLGAFGGAAIGFLAARLIRLNHRLLELQSEVEWLRGRLTGREPAKAAAETGTQAESKAEPQTTPQTKPQSETKTDAQPGQPVKDSAGAPAPARAMKAQPTPPTLRPEVADRPREAPRPVVELPTPYLETLIRRLGAWVSGWFTSGNVPVKVGVILSFIGVSFFLKYAIDNELLTVPIEFRLLAVAAAGVALVVFGWRLRKRLRVYAISLQGGGVGILFLTIFAAFRIWQLVPAGLAFALLAALAAFTGALAVLQKARTLIILGAVGGFLAPVLASTGQGSHVALFSYYLVLNLLILAVAWFRAWRAVNLVGFVFTFVIGSLWGYRYYKPHLFASTEPFLVIHFLLYQAIAILYALRQPPKKIGLVDGTLVFGTPVIVFALQAALVRDTEYGLAISAAVLAVFYALTATWLHRRPGKALGVLRDCFVALAVAFATIAIPLALDARWTATAWALEGAALVWLATRQPQHLANFAGAALIVFSGLSFMVHGWRADEGWPALNGNVLNGVLISLSGLFAARRLEHFSLPPIGRGYHAMAWGLFAWGAGWWLATGFAEISDRVPRLQQLHAGALFVAASAALVAWVGRARDWRMARQLAVLCLPGLVLLALQCVDDHGHCLFGLGWLAWPVAFAIQAGLLNLMDRDGHPLARAWHMVAVLFMTVFVMVEVDFNVRAGVPGAWAEAAASAIPGVVALIIWRFRNRPAWPIPAHALAYRVFSLVLVAGQLLFLCAISIESPGSPGRLPYLPVLNPYDLAVLFAGVMALLSWVVLRRDAKVFGHARVGAFLPAYRVFLVAAFLLLTTLALLRGVYHLADVPWRYNPMSSSVVAQTALSIYWGVLGFTGMVVGARRGQRRLWLAGAGFMALVVLKLFLVDLGNSGTIERIISFIGVGVLLLVVGYFAPAPPRLTEKSSDE